MSTTIPTTDAATPDAGKAAASARPTVAQPRRRKLRFGAGAGDRPGFLLYGLLAAFVLATAYPLWWSFVVGSGTNATRGETLPMLPGGNFLSNAAIVLDAIPFWKALGNSIIVSLVITVSVVTFSTLAGYAFAKLRFRGRDGLMVFVIATMAIPTQLGIIPLFMVMRQLGWTGELGAVIVPMLVTAFGVFFMRQYLVDVIPDELIEAARVDGAGQFRTFLTVAVPAARPAMAILGLFTFMMAWTDYLWPLIVLNPGNPTLQTALGQLQSGYYIDYSIVLTGAVMATIPLLILFVVAGKQLISGIMAGAVKG
jgi:cellobiose transport system permease protein